MRACMRACVCVSVHNRVANVCTIGILQQQRYGHWRNQRRDYERKEGSWFSRNKVTDFLVYKQMHTHLI